MIAHSILLAQAEVAVQAVNSPNWVLIGVIVGVFVILGILLLIPVKPRIAEDEPNKALTDETNAAVKGEKEGKEDKAKLSLAEIKEGKRESVAAEMSKEELRELRKERRAATQTDKAVHEREEAVKDAEPEEKQAESAEAENAEAEIAVDDSADAEKGKMTSPIDDVVTKPGTDTGDVFASLFGGEKEDLFGSVDSQLDFDLGETPKPEDGTVFPTLGSKLIPLSEITESAKESKENDLDPLDELTKRLSERSEKKTLN